MRQIDVDAILCYLVLAGGVVLGGILLLRVLGMWRWGS